MSCLFPMGEFAPFHVQLREQLLRRFRTSDDLLRLLRAAVDRQPCDPVSQMLSGLEPELGRELDAILVGRLAPTKPLGQLIADLVIGPRDQLSTSGQQLWDELVGAAYVAECYGRRSQPPYLDGVIDCTRRNNAAQIASLHESRQRMVHEQRQQRLLTRLIELEEEQANRAARVTPPGSGRAASATASPRTNNHTARQDSQLRSRTLKSISIKRLSPTSPSRWNAAATEALAYIPEQARRDDAGCEESFMHVVERCFSAACQFPEFLEALLSAWRSEQPSVRGRFQSRMSPEQLGQWIAVQNTSRYRSDRRQQAWFRQHNGPGVTGSALRNYLTRHSERPNRECLQKMVSAFVPEGDVQLDVEQRLWRMAGNTFSVRPAGVEALTGVLDCDWQSARTQRHMCRQYSLPLSVAQNARVLQVSLRDELGTYCALADETGLLLTPLVNSRNRRVIADIAMVRPADNALLTSVELALAESDRGKLVRALVDSSGFPLTRIAELTDVHESLFQQWMRQGTERCIEDRQRAARIVDLLNPPDLARFPLTPERIRRQNERAITLLTSHIGSLEEAIEAAGTCSVPERCRLDDEAIKTYRAAQLLRRVFGRDSLSSLTGPQVGKQLALCGLGDTQVFRHLREGIRENGRKSARRATLAQAEFLADLLEQTTPGISPHSRSRFIEFVACVDPHAVQVPVSPAQLLRQIEDGNSPFTIHSMTGKIIEQRGGIVRLSREVGVSPQSLRAFALDDGHFLHHRVAGRLAEHGMGFYPGSENYRRFVILSTASWKKGRRQVPTRLSAIVLEYRDRVRNSVSPQELRAIRAEFMGLVLSQAALSPAELAESLGVTRAVLAGWTTPRIARFTSHAALNKFAKLVHYRDEQIEFLKETFGPSAADS